MRIIQTASDDLFRLGEMAKYWTYCGLDSMLTLEVLSKIKPQLTPEILPVYHFALGLQAPIMEISLRGMRVDPIAKDDLIYELSQKADRLKSILDTFADAVWDKPLNPNSPDQLKTFFYGILKIPPVWVSTKGVKRISTNREALEKIEIYLYARPFVKLILALRDINKRLSVLRKGIDPDGRMRSAYNIGGTATGRLSSSENAFGTGDNAQNQNERQRHIYIADPGMKLCYADLEQAESRAVAAISGDDAYWEACHSGDLHTTVCQMVWPNIGWTEDAKKNKDEIAGKIFYRDFTYRDMSKRGGHGSNYMGSPWTMAKHLKVATEVMVDFHARYFKAFPGLPRWHNHVAIQIQTKGVLFTPLGRRRYFFGRRDADETIRAAVAHEPQSHVGDVLNLGLWRVWKHCPEVQLLAQVHDAILFQFPENREVELVNKVLTLLAFPVIVNGRVLTIPSEAATGWNWAKYVDEKASLKKGTPLNLDGLKGFKGEQDNRTRTPSKKANLLDRIIL